MSATQQDGTVRRDVVQADPAPAHQEVPPLLAGDAATPGHHGALGLVPDEDQESRLERFRAAHPELIILLLGAQPRAWVGGRKIERRTLRGLFDALEEIFPPNTQASDARAAQ
jgi:hypothetical protein